MYVPRRRSGLNGPRFGKLSGLLRANHFLAGLEKGVLTTWVRSCVAKSWVDTRKASVDIFADIGLTKAAGVMRLMSLQVLSEPAPSPSGVLPSRSMEYVLEGVVDLTRGSADVGDNLELFKLRWRGTPGSSTNF